MKKKTAITILLFIILVVLLLDATNTLTYGIASGSSNGKPYCLYCITLETHYLKPSIGQEALYYNEWNLRASHRMIDENSTHIKIIAYPQENKTFIQSIPKENVIGVTLLTIPISTTDNFTEGSKKAGEIAVWLYEENLK